MPDKLQSRKDFSTIFLVERLYYTLKDQTVFLHVFIKLHYFLFPFIMQNGYRYHWKA